MNTKDIFGDEIGPKETTLWYHGYNEANKSKSSDKVYIVKLLPSQVYQDTWDVICLYGKRGKTLQSTTKTSGRSWFGAKSQYNECIRAKTDKGYEVTEFVVEIEEMHTVFDYNN